MTWYGTMVVQGDGMQGNGMQWYGMCSTIRRIYACLSVYSHACMCMHAPACTHNALRSAGMLCTANANNKRYINIIMIMIVIVIIHTHTHIYIIKWAFAAPRCSVLTCGSLRGTWPLKHRSISSERRLLCSNSQLPKALLIGRTDTLQIKSRTCCRRTILNRCNTC